MCASLHHFLTQRAKANSGSAVQGRDNIAFDIDTGFDFDEPAPKHRDDAGMDSGDTSTGPAYFQDIAVPWMPTQVLDDIASESYLRRLEIEILRFVDYTALTDYEVLARTHLIDTVTSIASDLFPGSEVFSYGSTESCLASYSSDIDLCVMLPPSYRAGSRNQCIGKMARRLKQTISKKSIETRLTAHVPIINAIHDELGIEYDICFNQPDCRTSTLYVTNYIAKHPIARILMVLVKALLRKRSLNKPFSGGMSSFILFPLVAAYIDERHLIFPYKLPSSGGSKAASELLRSFIKSSKLQECLPSARFLTHSGDKRAPESTLCATCLLEFLEFYGTVYSEDANLICLCGGKHALAFESRYPMHNFREAHFGRSREYDSSICIMSPVDDASEIGGAVRKYSFIKSCFETAYFQLLRTSGVYVHKDASGDHKRCCSILSNLLEADRIGETTRNNSRRWYEGLCETGIQLGDGHIPVELSRVVSVSSIKDLQDEAVTPLGSSLFQFEPSDSVQRLAEPLSIASFSTFRKLQEVSQRSSVKDSSVAASDVSVQSISDEDEGKPMLSNKAFLSAPSFEDISESSTFV